MKSVVLLSGGLDSALTLALSSDPVEALTVDYGQRHRREIHAAATIAEHYGVPWRLVTVDPALYAGAQSALLGTSDVPDGHAEKIDATYVPARNTMLVSMAVVRAEVLGAGVVSFGANADDAAGYPDCRAHYIECFRDVILTGTQGHVWLDAPLRSMTKQQVIAAAREHNVPISLTWSCYQGAADGPCGRCGACQAQAVS